MLRALCRHPGLARVAGTELLPGPAATRWRWSTPRPWACTGISGLSVADASIMPRIVGGNTNAAPILIAALGAEKIDAAL
ncbi:alcohol dehydrogenase (acceptor) [Citreicella sp. SE45]|nr:alcohol dehydrogenase (acceptor) [Citreicella sp. SE45]